jgi:hypothetical protein
MAEVAAGQSKHEEKKMSVFGSIVSAIFGSKHAASVTAAAGSAEPSPSAGSAKGASAPSPPPAAAAGASPASAGTSTVSAAAAKPISKTDVEAILAKLADDQDEDYDWKRSIVDLMKLLKLDSGLGVRKQLAQELGYTGALDGSAEMNVWLHKQVMTKLAESGGKVPDSFKA